VLAVTPAERYGSGYWTGAADEHAGITMPERGYPDDPLWLRGMRHGRQDYRRRVESLLTDRLTDRLTDIKDREDACRSTCTPRW